MADGYDEDVRDAESLYDYPFAAYRPVLNKVCQIVSTKKGSILDPGFGTGISTKTLYDQGCELTGIDFSGRMVEIAKKKMPQAELIQWDFSKGLPKLKTAPFKWIISTYAFHI
ncbi:MAG: class I SAM-dependent methyltransferase [Firmicutes bacterium]|nr:class I SAM-dependent methyltransferase [Bacillota bacterium]